MSPDSPQNEQESWNKRFEMSLAEIYMELPDGHRAKKDYEALIAEPRGKMVEMSMRLDELEETVRELKLKAPSLIAAPQPVATGLCEAVEPLLKRCSDMAKNDDVCGCEQDHICGLPEFCREIDNVRHALTAERKRAVLVGNCIDSYERLLKEITRDECKHPNADSFNGCYLCNAVGDAKTAKHRLDAFDKGAV